MRAFDYVRASDLPTALRHAALPDSRFLAGGTTLLDLMKCGVERPGRVVDISGIAPLEFIEIDEATIRIGALTKMSRVAAHPAIKATAPAIAETLWRAASPQLRNMASIGGNIMQRTRCTYFRDPAAYPNCNKRSPGSGCAAAQGNHRNHAVLGISDACFAAYPGDLAVALIAFDASITLKGETDRQIPFDEFFLPLESGPNAEHDLRAGEMIIAIKVPRSAALRRSHYLKVRDRASYEFATASAAVGLELEADGKTVRTVRVALGGVAGKPWRAQAVEKALVGRPLDETAIRSASKLAVEGAVAHEQNAFKITLIPRVVARALSVVGGLS